MMAVEEAEKRQAAPTQEKAAPTRKKRQNGGRKRAKAS
jgi:hypothetical protein